MLSLHGSMLQKYEDCGIVDDSKMESPPDATFQQLEPKFDKNIFEYENRFDEETEIEDSVANPRKITFGNLKLIDSDGEQDLESLVEVDTPITATPEKEDPATPENEGPTEEIATPAEKAKGIKKGKNKASKSNSLSNNERAVRDVSPVLDESKNSKKRKPADEQKIQARKPKKLKKSK